MRGRKEKREKSTEHEERKVRDWEGVREGGGGTDEKGGRWRDGRKGSEI